MQNRSICDNSSQAKAGRHGHYLQSDAYWADSFEVDEDHYVAIITDERPDGPLGRPHRELGEKIVVPNHKIKWDEGNPTGHGIIFIGIGGQVYCYVPPGGV
jgi:hypothetical protein